METKKLVIKISFFVLLLSVFHPTTAFALQEKVIDKLQSMERLQLTSVVGPESLAFDPSGGGPYTGVSDGRVFKWRGPTLGWAQFATNSNHRNGACDDSNNIRMEGVCGRPLGLQFYQAMGDLYIADAYLGLLRVGPEGGVAMPLATSADGEPFRFLNGLDVDQENGMVYFTDSSSRFQRRDYVEIVITGDATGRLLKYDPVSKNVSMLVKGLVYPNGVAISKDNMFLLIAETTTCRILKYWIRGPKIGTMEVFAELPGYPDNIKKNHAGEFWVALSQVKVQLYDMLWLKKYSELRRSGRPLGHPIAVRLSKEGRVLEVLDGSAMSSISEVEESNGILWVGSVVMPYVGVYKP